MEREIKFRGIVKYNGNHLFEGDLVFGSLIIKTKGIFIYIIEEDEFGNIVREFEVEVKPETIGQFTGLKNKNGVDIYSGDFDENYDVVTWCDVRNGWSMSAYDFPNKEVVFCHCHSCEGNFEISDQIDQMEIIGNIHI